jgi:plastocyanin
VTARRLIQAGGAALAALALAAGVAYADATIYAAPPNQFAGGDVTIAQGAKVTFTNGDTVAHDVTAAAKGADGKALFASDQIGPAQSAPVAGVEYLTTGKYEYICSIHPFMKGTITVSSEGAPVPRPGSGPPPSSPASADTVAPAASVKVLDTKRSAVRKRRSLQLEVRTDEAAALAITARSGKTTVATGTARLNKAGTRKVTVKLTRAGLKLVKSSRTVRIAVAVDARDAAGNASSASASGRLR